MIWVIAFTENTNCCFGPVHLRIEIELELNKMNLFELINAFHQYIELNFYSMLAKNM